MAKQEINIGIVANDNTGDPLRIAMNKINLNFTELYDRPAIPNQYGNAGKILTTNGSLTSWINNPATYTLPTASNSVKGGIKIGSGLTVDPVSGIMSVTVGDASLGDLTITSSSVASDTSNNTLDLDSSAGIKLATALTNGITLSTDGDSNTWTFDANGNTVTPNDSWIGPQTHNSITFSDDAALSYVKLKVQDSDTTIVYSWDFKAGGDLEVPGNILPQTDITQDLGSPTKRFKDLYLSGSTITLGDSTISSTPSGSVTVSGGITATKSIIKVDKLTRTLATSNWSDGVYSTTGSEWTPTLPNGLVINRQDGTYKFGYKVYGPAATLSFADWSQYEGWVIGDYTIPGTSLGGTSPANDLTITVESLTTDPLVAISTETSYLGGAHAEFRLVASGTLSSDVTHSLFSSGAGWPQNIEGFDLTVTHPDFTGSLVVHCNAVGTGTFSTYTVVTNTLSYNGLYKANEITIKSGTPSTTGFYPGNTVTLPVDPRSNSDLSVEYYIWWRGDDDFSNGPNSGEIDNFETPIELDSSTWNITGGVLTLTLPSEFATHGIDSNGTITVNETNAIGLDFPSGIMGPFAARDVTISDGGGPAQGATAYIPAEYSVTYDVSDYITAIDIINPGYDWLLLDPHLMYTSGSLTPEFVTTTVEFDGGVVPTMITEETTSTVPVSGGAATFSDLIVSGDLTVSGDIRVRPDSIYLGTLKLSTTDGTTLLVNDSPLSGGSTGDVTFTGTTITGTGNTLTLKADSTADYGLELFNSIDNDTHLRPLQRGKGVAIGFAYGMGSHIRVEGTDGQGGIANSGDRVGIFAMDTDTGNSAEWIFDNDGSLTFPDSTVQTTGIVQGQYDFLIDGTNTSNTITTLDFNVVVAQPAVGYAGSDTHTLQIPAGTPGQRLTVINKSTLCTVEISSGGITSGIAPIGIAEFIYVTDPFGGDGWTALYGVAP